MSAQENPVFRFADCELDPGEHRLLVHGQVVTLTPKVFETLVLLVERAGHVVSKDELMAALWPRGFVHESNLTKHIWLIRRALGDGEEESRFIETVPKLGYRFAAPVQPAARAGLWQENVTEQYVGAIPSRDSAIHATAANEHAQSIGPPAHMIAMEPEVRVLAVAGADRTVAARRRKRVWLLGITVALVALVGGAFWWRVAKTAAGNAVSVQDPGAVAIIDFSNLSGNAKDAWLGPALEQMLATELAANGKLHAVSEELVRPADADLPVPGAGGYAQASLAKLQRRLGSHYVLTGAYVVSGPADTPQLRVDLTVQDAQTGKAFASLSRSTAVNDLPKLVAQVGSELRSRFGEAPFNPTVLEQIAAAQPPSAEVARHVGFAMQALQEYDPARARDELLQAVAQSPGYAPAYLYLSRAWSMLGYRAKAVAAATQAAQYVAGLPREQQLQIRAWQAALAGDAVQVSAIQGELVTLRPNDPAYRLQWIRELTAAAKYDAAKNALAGARKLQALAGDPRLELAAANLAFSRGNFETMIRHARLALAQARERGVVGLAAEAELQLGIGLQRDPQAEAMLRSAIADYHHIGNPHGEAHAWQNLGNLQGWLNRVADERESYQRAMTIYQGIGDLGGEAAIYDNLSDMLWSAGDRDGTEAALRQALAIARETSNAESQAWTLTGLATVMSDESASDEAAGMYREAIALDRESGAREHLAFALPTYADLLRMRGQLDQAGAICTQAQAAQQKLDVSDQGTAARFECAQIALDRGEVNAAAASLKKIESKALAAKDTFDASNAQLVLGQIAMGRKQWPMARDMLQKSLQGWTAMNQTPGVATATALLALCADAMGDTATHDKLAAQARALRGGVTERAEAFTLDVALAELQAAADRRDQGLASLRALAGDATRRNWVGLAFEARLAALRVLERGSDASAAESTRAALVADARKAGYGWVAQRAVPASSEPQRITQH